MEEVLISRLEVGRDYKRKTLHDSFGGQRMHGISTPDKFKAIFLFSNKFYSVTSPDQVKRDVHGYCDRWQEVDKLYYYSGEGQLGDMTFTVSLFKFLNIRERKRKN